MAALKTLEVWNQAYHKIRRLVVCLVEKSKLLEMALY